MGLKDYDQHVDPSLDAQVGIAGSLPADEMAGLELTLSWREKPLPPVEEELNTAPRDGTLVADAGSRILQPPIIPNRSLAL